MAIPILYTIESGTTVATHNFPTDDGIDYRGGKSTFAFSGASGAFTNVSSIKIQASFDDTNWIDLTDSADNPVDFDDATILTVDIGKCKLRFRTVVSNNPTTSDINITVS
jgi:hypothetical protein